MLDYIKAIVKKYEDFDINDEFIHFYKATLSKNIGKFKKGDIVNISLDMEEGKLHISELDEDFDEKAGGKHSTLSFFITVKE